MYHEFLVLLEGGATLGKVSNVEKMVKSIFSDVAIPEVSIHELVFQCMDVYEDEIAIIDGTNDQKYTYGESLKCTRQVASGLARLGVRKGDVVALFGPNSPEYVFIFYALLANGATVTTLNPAYTVYEVSHHLGDSQASWLFTTPEGVDIATKAVGDTGQLKGIICNGSAPGTVPFARLLADDGSCYPDDVKILIFSHEDLFPERRVDRKAVLLGIMPFFHAYGMVATMTGSLLSGATCVTLPTFQPEQFLRTIEKHKVTTLHIVPPIVQFMSQSPLLRNYDLSSIDSVTCGAAPLAAGTAKEFKKTVWKGNLTQGYGMTETTLSVTIMPYAKPWKQGSCGMLLPNTQAQIVEPGTNTVLGQQENGEIWVKGPNIMKGYWNKPQMTKDVLDSDGWLHTGDIGHYDDEGYFFIVDRQKELIKYKGFQVAPAELEALLLTHPSVADVGVVGVPDARAGEVPKAFVVRKTEAASLTEQDVMGFVADRLSDFKHLRGGVHFLAAIPKTLSGKILRRDLREMDRKSRL